MFLKHVETKSIHGHAVAFMCFDGDTSSMNVASRDHGHVRFPRAMTVGSQSLGLMRLLAVSHVMHLGNG